MTVLWLHLPVGSHWTRHPRHARGAVRTHIVSIFEIRHQMNFEWKCLFFAWAYIGKSEVHGCPSECEVECVGKASCGQMEYFRLTCRSDSVFTSSFYTTVSGV